MFRSTPDVYLPSAEQDGMSRRAVSAEMGGIPVRLLNAEEEAAIRFTLAEATSSAPAFVSSILERGYAVVSLTDAEWTVIGEVFGAWQSMCDLPDEVKWQSGQDHDGAGYAAVPGMFEQYNFAMQGGACARSLGGDLICDDLLSSTRTQLWNSVTVILSPRVGQC